MWEYYKKANNKVRTRLRRVIWYFLVWANNLWVFARIRSCESFFYFIIKNECCHSPRTNSIKVFWFWFDVELSVESMPRYVTNCN